MSSKNQVTIPVEALRAAGVGPGDVVRVEATGRGRLSLIALDELIEQCAGAFDSGGALQTEVEKLRDEWR